MALILNIETSTTVCSVALANNGEIISKRESHDEKSHARKLTIFIDEVIKESGFSFNQLDAIAVSKGPGSYTGLRIGVSAAKGLCYALEKPLIAINTLHLMCFGLIRKVNNGEVIIKNFNETILVPMIDARRMEVYNAFFTSKGEKTKEVTAEILNEKSFEELLTTKQLICFGDGAVKAKDIINQSNLIFVPDIFPLAEYMTLLSEERFYEKKFEDTAYFEPFYLKDFIATVPKKNIFG